MDLNLGGTRLYPLPLPCTSLSGVPEKTRCTSYLFLGLMFSSLHAVSLGQQAGMSSTVKGAHGLALLPHTCSAPDKTKSCVQGNKAEEPSEG